MTEDEICTFNNEQYHAMNAEAAPLGNLNVTVCKNFGFNVTALSKGMVA